MQVVGSIKTTLQEAHGSRRSLSVKLALSIALSSFVDRHLRLLDFPVEGLQCCHYVDKLLYRNYRHKDWITASNIVCLLNLGAVKRSSLACGISSQ